MQRLNDFLKYLDKYRLNEGQLKYSLEIVKMFLEYQVANPNIQNSAAVEEFTATILTQESNPVEAVIALARWCRFTNQEEGLIYLLTLFNTLGVLDTIIARIEDKIDTEQLEKIKQSASLPVFASKITAYPQVIKRFLRALQDAMSMEEIQDTLSGNNHQVAIENFQADKEAYLRLKDIDSYLEDKHQRMLEEMEKCYKNSTLWFEQKITPQVLEFVKSNQEICTGLRKDNYIYVTKIPYKVHEYLQEKNKQEKKYLYCHCPFVRSSILDDDVEVPDLWCYCSSGFTKTRFEVIFGKKVRIELLESVLSGADKCRFRIKIPIE